MGGENLLKDGYTDDPELQRREDEGYLDWTERVDRIMETRGAVERCESNARMTGYMCWEGAGSQVRKEASGLLKLS